MSLPESVTNCLRPSLFPRVPPYLKFVGHDETAAHKIPLPIQKHLKWKLTTITPIVVKRTLTNSGFRLVKSECDTAECPQEGMYFFLFTSHLHESWTLFDYVILQYKMSASKIKSSLINGSILSTKEKSS